MPESLPSLTILTPADDRHPAGGDRHAHRAATGRVQHPAATRFVRGLHRLQAIGMAAADDGPLGLAPIGKTQRVALVSFRVGSAPTP